MCDVISNVRTPLNLPWVIQWYSEIEKSRFHVTTDVNLNVSFGEKPILINAIDQMRPLVSSSTVVIENDPMGVIQHRKQKIYPYDTSYTVNVLLQTKMSHLIATNSLLSSVHPLTGPERNVSLVLTVLRATVTFPSYDQAQEGQ